MKQKKRFNMRVILLFLLLAIAIPAIANDDFDWNTIDRMGLYDRKHDSQIKRNIWDDYSQEQAIQALNILPNKLTSPSYRELAKRLLLSDAPKSKDDIDSPALLAKRLEKLISFGFLMEATELYQKAKDSGDLPDNFELSMIDVQLTLANGALAPVCLDVQASSSAFRDMPAWRELSNFCRLRFGSSEKIKLSDLKFENAPDLKNVLESDSIAIDTPQSNLGILVAFSDKRISDASYNAKANMAYNMPDLTIKMALNNAYVQNKTYQCYAIEAAKRGMIDTTELSNIYTNAKFSDETLSSDGGEITLHPCHIPAYFYQRLQKDEESHKEQLVNTLLSATTALPAYALSPMVDMIANNALPNNQWRASIILGALEKSIPDSFESNVEPLDSLSKNESLREKTFTEWLKNDIHQNIIKKNNIDLALLPYISSSLTSDNGNFTNNRKKIEYGKLFSLTYGKKSLYLGLGFNDYIETAHDNDDHVKVITSLLTLAAETDVKNFNPYDLSVILSGLKAYKLEKKAVALVFEYLQ